MLFQEEFSSFCTTYMIQAKSIEGLLLSILTRLDWDMTMIYGILLFGEEKVEHLIKEIMIQLYTEI